MRGVVCCRGGKHRPLARCRFSYTRSVKNWRITAGCIDSGRLTDCLASSCIATYWQANTIENGLRTTTFAQPCLSREPRTLKAASARRSPAAADDYRTASPTENNRADCGRGILLAVAIVADEYRQQRWPVCWRSLLLQQRAALLGYYWAIVLCGMSDRRGMSARRLIVLFGKHFVVKYWRTARSQPGFPLVGFPGSPTPENHAGRRILACLTSTGRRKTVTLASWRYTYVVHRATLDVRFDSLQSMSTYILVVS